MKTSGFVWFVETWVAAAHQFGGVGGNFHGLAHFDETQHEVSVKLGSITPEGSADVFCYKCSDEIKDPELANIWHTGE